MQAGQEEGRRPPASENQSETKKKEKASQQNHKAQGSPSKTTGVLASTKALSPLQE
jgi:hypothetical protein